MYRSKTVGINSKKEVTVDLGVTVEIGDIQVYGNNRHGEFIFNMQGMTLQKVWTTVRNVSYSEMTRQDSGSLRGVNFLALGNEIERVIYLWTSYEFAIITIVHREHRILKKSPMKHLICHEITTNLTRNQTLPKIFEKLDELL